MQFTTDRMEESNRALDSPDHAASSSSPPATVSSSNGGQSGAASTSTAEPQVEEEREAAEEEEVEDDEAGHPQLIQQRTSVSYDSRLSSTGNEEYVQLIRDDTWSCIVVILTFWFFVSMTMILGVYGSKNILLGPNSSILTKPNPLFVEYLKVEELEEATNQPTLYGFYKSPPLDVVTTWSETHKTFLPSRSHKEWVYFLNQGSQMNVSYRVNSPSSSSLVFVIAQGNDGFSQWLEDPSYPNSTLSWNTIHGSGVIQQDIYMSSSYYVAVANLNAEAVEVELKVKIRAFLYNTSGAYYKCSLTRGQCNFELSITGGNVVLLTSPSTTPGGGDQWYVNLSYGPRWMTYIAGIGVMTVVMFAAFHLLNNSECMHGRRAQHGDMQSARTPLLSNKDDDLSSWGSSYDSVSQDDEDLEGVQAIGSLEAKSTKDGEHINTRRLCAICFDAPRDCFFLPCGHCVACFACGTRIAEAAGTCPICRRHMKKVRKIFTV